jgi:hypothetical protein
VRARAPAHVDRRSPPVSLSRPRGLSLSPSPCLVGQACRRRSSRTRTRFSLCPADPTCQLVPNPPPTFPHRGRAHDRAISGHLHTSLPLLSPTPCSPTSPRSLAPSVEPSRPSLSLCARDQIAPLLLTEDRRLFCVRRRAHAPFVASVSSASPSATRDTLWFALPLSDLLGPRSLEHFLRSWSPAAVDPRLHRTPTIPQASRSLYLR